jgi:hypothetical protein
MHQGQFNRWRNCAQCLLARRMVGASAFRSIDASGWDQHNNLQKQVRGQCQDVDQPTTALVKDLKHAACWVRHWSSGVVNLAAPVQPG